MEANYPNDASYDNGNSYDVFLCHNGADKSEVSVLADSLKNKGLKPWFDDWNIAPGQNFIDKLQSSIQSINCFAIFLGKNGLGQWQQDEFHSILHEAKRRDCKVIPVYLKTAPPDAEFPPFLQSQNIVDLRKTDKDELGRLIWGISDIKIDQTVYIAQVTVDLDDYRQQIINCLRQRGIRVLPETNDTYPEEIEQFKTEAKKDLDQSILAIQLLSKYPGKGPKDFVKIQSDIIKSCNKPCVLWRSRDLDIENISDGEHKNFIEQKEAKVLAISIEEFKDKVIQEHDILTKQKLESSKNKDTESLEHKTIFINAQEEDLELAQMISDQLKKWEIDCLKSIKYRNSRELKQDEKSKLEHSHGVIIVYGNTSPFWISQTSMRCRKISRDIFKKRKIPKLISIFNGPPPPKEDPGIDTKDIHTIDSQTGIDTAKLYEFVEKINC